MDGEKMYVRRVCKQDVGKKSVCKKSVDKKRVVKKDVYKKSIGSSLNHLSYYPLIKYAVCDILTFSFSHLYCLLIYI